MKKYVNNLQCWNKFSVTLKKTSELVKIFEEKYVNNLQCWNKFSVTLKKTRELVKIFGE